MKTADLATGWLDALARTDLTPRTLYPCLILSENRKNRNNRYIPPNQQSGHSPWLALNAYLAIRPFSTCSPLSLSVIAFDHFFQRELQCIAEFVLFVLANFNNLLLSRQQPPFTHRCSLTTLVAGCWEQTNNTTTLLPATMSSSDGFNDNPEEGLHPQIREVLRAFENRVRSLENENKEARRQIASLNREIQVLRQSESNNENNNINIAQPTNSSSRPGVKQRGLVIQPAQSTDSPRAAAAGAGANERALIYEPDEHKAGLSEDTFSLMKINPILSMSWLYSTIVYIIQFTLLLMIFAEQISSSSNSTPFDVPFVVGPTVRVGQLLAIVITVVLAQDVLMPIKELSMLWITNPKQWMKVTGYDGGCMTWVMRILLPNILQLIIGTLAVMVSFVIIIQSEDVIELLADFAAMSVIAELDNVAFWFAGQGYAGDVIMKDTVKIREVEVDSLERRKLIGINLRPFLFIALLMVMIGGFTPIIIGQTNGDFFHLKYPNCAIKSTEQIDMIGNGVCDGGYINRYECGFDGGDCQNFNSQYPTCDAANPEEVGDGECHQTYNTEDCGYDGGEIAWYFHLYL